MNLKNIGENIKYMRTEMGLTQSQLAEKAGISTVHMSHIETGAVSMSLECLINISNGLQTTPDSVLMGEFEFFPESSFSVIDKYTQNLSSDENRLLIEIAKLLENLKVNKDENK